MRIKNKIILALIFSALILPIFASAELININTADATKLDEIPEVGPSTAGKIIDYRTANGPFGTIEDIMKVSGIKEATFAKMKDFITVGSVNASSGNSIPNQTSNNSDSDNQTSDNKSDDSSDYSANANPTDLSNYEKPETFKIGAGRERLATARTPVIFSVAQNKVGKVSNYFTWNFGDGSYATGPKVLHAYQFPGRYNVVLNGAIDDKEEATARTTVLVIESQVKITNVDSSQNFVEISNLGEHEQNLNGWSLRLNEFLSYRFPLDTIISPKSALKIPMKALGFDLSKFNKIVLAYPDGGVVSGAELTGAKTIDKNKLISLQNKLKQLRGEASKLASSPKPEKAIPEKIPTKPKNVVVLRKEPGLFEKIKNAIF